MGRDEIVRFFADYAFMLKAPVECGFHVASVDPAEGSNRVIVRGANGTAFDADNVVVAVGGYHRPKVLPVSEQQARS
jgi:putative flavoprotein involved in K+ transport